MSGYENEEFEGTPDVLDPQNPDPPASPPLRYQNPRIVAYKSMQDLQVLKDWFYDFNETKDNRFRAVQRVKALSSRGKLPHGVESTSLLTSTILQDNDSVDSSAVQLAYSMALIRFVNGLIDPFQQGQYATPMHLIAKSLGLPGFFVELRHMGTHESIPPLALCRIACNRALNWLFDHYWCHVDSEESHYHEYVPEELERIVDTESELARIKGAYEAKLESSQLFTNLKSYKKIRKANMDSDHLPVDNKKNVTFWRVVRGIKKVLGMDTFIKHPEFANFKGADLVTSQLIFKNFLIYNEDKISEGGKLKFNVLLIKLYKPLLEELGPRFKLKLFLQISQVLSRHFGKEASPRARFNEEIGIEKLGHPFEVIQLLEWQNFLVGDLFSFEPEYNLYVINTDSDIDVTAKPIAGTSSTHVRSKFDLVNLLIDNITQLFGKSKNQNSEIFLKVLENFNTITNLRNPTKDKIESLIRRVKYIVDFQKYKAPSLDDVLGDSKRKSEEEHVSTKKQKGSTFLFEQHENWTPVPFGVPI